MTEIKIKNKKVPWPWILAFVLLALILYLVLSFGRKEPDQENESNEATTILIDNNMTLPEFVNLIKNKNTEMELDQAYTNETLLRLMEATKAVAVGKNFDIRAESDTVKAYMRMFRGNELAIGQANKTKKSADILTIALQHLQKAKYPELRIEILQLEASSDLLKPDVLALEQKEAVNAFLQNAAELILKMDKSPTKI